MLQGLLKAVKDKVSDIFDESEAEWQEKALGAIFTMCNRQRLARDYSWKNGIWCVEEIGGVIPRKITDESVVFEEAAP